MLGNAATLRRVATASDWPPMSYARPDSAKEGPRGPPSPFPGERVASEYRPPAAERGIVGFTGTQQVRVLSLSASSPTPEDRRCSPLRPTMASPQPLEDDHASFLASKPDASMQEPSRLPVGLPPCRRRCSIVRSPLPAHSLIVGTPTLVSSAAASIVTKGWRCREGNDLAVMIITVGAMADLPHRPVGLRFHWRMATIDCPGDLGRLSAGLELPVLRWSNSEPG
jgi:hypothetical protein